ncbi:CDP-diacylglycerol--glycerol-3-phosphate 3-phosphatidyltransferase [Afifella sp. IM 167]|uniref:CDP-diacylglycerol--glycerol-3-phosphate 3-phosphatidyltransferase n=1 Tax=Afifella sp. IM 167 TaxID=2033586 RepID=UPI001CCFAD7F|nr:CDP-diacylglycerol--glycerol-3-phosphate 3-phosphatidyltransferase [Afifella sp. IM 167]MBZ8134899.1 CDP-diacylglycerol--glycerol-3-phosphate 3-phosphatidyltransferase [Afifella sp. IM 167]
MEAHEAARSPQLQALTIPNMLTFGRIAAAPLVGATFFIPGNAGPWIAFTIFVIASITDYFDGYLARIWEQQSALGRMLDPIADKLLVAVSILILVADGMLAGWSIWAGIIILMREMLVSGLREFLADLRVSVPVTKLAKWKTTLQLVAIAALLIAPALQGAKSGFIINTGLAFFWVAAIVTLYTGYDYFRAGLKHLVAE